MRECRAAPARRIRAARPWPDIREYSCGRPSLSRMRRSAFKLLLRDRARRPGPARLSLRQVRRDLLAGFDQALHRRGRLLEGRLLGAVEIDFDDALDALGADPHRHADIDVLHAVLAVEIS